MLSVWISIRASNEDYYSQKPNDADYSWGGSKLVHQATGTKDNEWGTHLPHEPTGDGQHEEHLQLPKGQALDTLSRQPEAGKARLEPARFEYVWKPQWRLIRLILTTQSRWVFARTEPVLVAHVQVLATDEVCFSTELSASAQTLLNARWPQHEHKSHNFLVATAPGSVVAHMAWSWSDVFILGISFPQVFCFSSSHTLGFPTKTSVQIECNTFFAVLQSSQTDKLKKWSQGVKNRCKIESRCWEIVLLMSFISSALGPSAVCSVKAGRMLATRLTVLIGERRRAVGGWIWNSLG